LWWCITAVFPDRIVLYVAATADGVALRDVNGPRQRLMADAFSTSAPNFVAFAPAKRVRSGRDSSRSLPADWRTAET
jgi:hypothetical protein